MRPAEPRAVWVRAFFIALAFTFCALGVRLFFGYPRCQNDELNWVQIARSIDSGQDWPVSGPSFIYILRALKEQTQLHYAHLISGLGVFSVFTGSLLLIFGFTRLRIAKPGFTLMALAFSSYFWVPLLEARPQQWGQILVFLGAIAAWLWLHRRGGWALFPILLLVSVSHILSHAILVWVCAVLTLADYFENRPLNRRHVILIAASLLSLVVYVVPGGPYQTMLIDIQHNHLHRLLYVAPYLGAAALGVILLVVALQPRLHWRSHWSLATARYVLAHRRTICIGLFLLVLAALSTQALILPAASWLPYGGSPWTFLYFQIGNLAFAALFARGIFHFLNGILAHEIDMSNSRLLIWALVAFGILASITLVASFWMLDTNWLLRLLNYAILFAAPIAALSLQNSRTLQRWPALYVLAIPLFLLSICQAVRPVGYLGC